jgi:hypothetical protein
MCVQALGCILYTLCFISHPFQDAGNLGILSAKVTMPSDNSIPDTAKTMISRMLDVSDRMVVIMYMIAVATDIVLKLHETSSNICNLYLFILHTKK